MWMPGGSWPGTAVSEGVAWRLPGPRPVDGGTAVELAEGLRVRPERMRANLDMTARQVVTERVAAHLAPLLGKAGARKLMTDAARAAGRSGRPLAEVLPGLPGWPAAAAATGELAELCDPAGYTGAAALVDRALRH
jgi:3-carboxy-cis,cis-muconate cycloisomerase